MTTPRMVQRKQSFLSFFSREKTRPKITKREKPLTINHFSHSDTNSNVILKSRVDDTSLALSNNDANQNSGQHGTNLGYNHPTNGGYRDGHGAHGQNGAHLHTRLNANNGHSNAQDYTQSSRERTPPHGNIHAPTGNQQPQHPTGRHGSPGHGTTAHPPHGQTQNPHNSVVGNDASVEHFGTSFGTDKAKEGTRSNFNINYKEEQPYIYDEDRGDLLDSNGERRTAQNCLGRNGKNIEELNKKLSEESGSKNKYNKVNKSQTFRGKFIKYNRPARTKSDLSHLHKRPKGHSTSDIQNAVDQDISNNLKFNRVNRHNSMNKSIGDIKSNFYISTNKLNDGLSNLDHDRNDDLDVDLEDGQEEEEIIQNQQCVVGVGRALLAKSYSDYTKKLLQVTPRETETLGASNISRKGLAPNATAKERLESPANLKEVLSCALDSVGDEGSKNNSKRGSPEADRRRLADLNVNSSHLDRPGLPTPEERQNTQFTKYVKKLKRRLTNAAMRGSNMSLSKHTSEKDFQLKNETCTNSSGIVENKTNEDRSSLEESQGAAVDTRLVNNFVSKKTSEARSKSRNIYHSTHELSHEPVDLHGRSNSVNQLKGGSPGNATTRKLSIKNQDQYLSPTEKRRVRRSHETGQTSSSEDRSSETDEDEGIADAAPEHHAAEHRRNTKASHLNFFRNQEKSERAENAITERSDSKPPAGPTSASINQHPHHRDRDNHRDRERDSNHQSTPDDLNKSCSNLKNAEVICKSNNNIKEKILYFDTNKEEGKASTKEASRSPSNSHDRKAKSKLLATFARSNFRNNPNFVKRSITSISAKGDAVRSKYGAGRELFNNPYGELGPSRNNVSGTRDDSGTANPRDRERDRERDRDRDGNDANNANNSASQNQNNSSNNNNNTAPANTTDRFAGITKRYSSSNQYRNFIKERFSPKSKTDANGTKTTIQVGSPQLTAAQINEKIKKEIESNNSRTTQQLNLLMNKTMKWVMTQDFKKYMPADIQEYKNDVATIQIGH